MRRQKISQQMPFCEQVKQLISEQKLHQQLSFLWVRNLHIKRTIWMGDLLGVELPCAREHAERGGGAGLAGSIAGENWHNPIEPRSFLPAESLALHQPSGMARPGSLSIAWRLGFLFLVICSSYWTQTQRLWREQAFIAAHQSCLWLGQRETGKGSIHTLNLLGSGPGTEAAPAQSCVCTAGLWKGALPQCSHPSIPSPPIYYNQMLTIFFSCSFSLVHSSTMVRTAFNPAFQSFTWFLYNVQVKTVVELWAFWAEFIKKNLKIQQRTLLLYWNLRSIF